MRIPGWLVELAVAINPMSIEYSDWGLGRL